jgi:carboxypeptidase Taq
VKVVKKAYEKQVKVPLPLLMETIKAQTMGHEAWVKAKTQSDFSIFNHTWKRSLTCASNMLICSSPMIIFMIPLLDDFEPGMKTAEVKEIFEKLRRKQVELLQEIAEKEPPDDSFIKQHYKEEYQERFGRHVITRFGYDWQRGRLDVAPHPFTTEFGHGDVRITTRYLKEDAGLSFVRYHARGRARHVRPGCA